MEVRQQLLALISDLLKVPQSQIGSDFSLNHRKISGSVGRTVLRSAIKTRFGKSIDVNGIGTFGQLLAALDGSSTLPDSSARLAESSGVEQHIVPCSSPTLSGCGVDIESVDAMPETGEYWQHAFYIHNFTPAEIAYCVSQAEPRQHFAARWCAKEALRKCVPSFIDMPFKQLQVGKRGDASVYLQISDGDDGWTDLPVSLSISHIPLMAVAMVVGETIRGDAKEACSTTLAGNEVVPPPSVPKQRSLMKTLLKRILGRE